MSGTRGTITWTAFKAERNPIIAGRRIGGAVESYSSSIAGGQAGVIKPLASGGSVYCATPLDAGSPLSVAPESIGFGVSGGFEEDYFAIKRLWALAGDRPVPMFSDDPVEDVWVIPSASRTSWVLSRSTAFGGLAPYADYTPRAFLVDAEDWATLEELAVVNAAPGAGEVQVDNAANSTSITTASLTAEAGRLLVFRYHPLRYVNVSSFSEGISQRNGLTYSFTVNEHVPKRLYV